MKDIPTFDEAETKAIMRDNVLDLLGVRVLDHAPGVGLGAVDVGEAVLRRRAARR